MSTPRILIVEDDDDLREIVEMDFQRDGFRTETAMGGHAALKQLQASRVDVIVSDFHMPHGGGLELLRSVREIHPELPFCLLASGLNEISLEEAYAQGATALLSKPFLQATLSTAIRRALLPKKERWTGRASAANASSLPHISTAQAGFGHGGLFLPLEQDLPALNSSIHFEVAAAADTPALSGEGVVRWQRKDGIGVELISLNDRDRENFIAWVEHQRPIAFIPRHLSLAEPKRSLS